MMKLKPHPERGVALLTVLVVLTILVVFATAFIQTVRIENETTANFKYGIMVQDTAKSGVESLREEFTNLLNGHDGIPFTGDEIRPYISQIDSWAIGKADVIDYTDPRTVYDLRRWDFNTDLIQQNPNAVIIHNGSIWEVRPGNAFARTGNFDPFIYFSRRGVDEDPPGEVSRDGAPGIAGVDDDFDGLTDPPGRPPSEGGVEDDDEDGLRDEDGVEIRRTFLGESIDQGGRIDSLGMGFDNDGDFNGIDPAAGRINISIAGNRNLVANPPVPREPFRSLHTYHSGIHPSELDLETFMTAMLGTRLGLVMSQRIIEFREGFSRGPGIGGADEVSERDIDNEFVGNSTPQILEPNSSPAYYESSNTDKNLVPGDRSDNDGDGLTDEEDELLAWRETIQYDGTSVVDGVPRPSDLLDNRGNRAFVLSNGIDDGGITSVPDDAFEIDDPQIGIGNEQNPGIDDLRETRPSSPFGDDAPPRSRYVIQLIEGMTAPINSSFEGSPTVYDVIQRFITITSTTQRMRQENETDLVGNRPKLNPNLTIKQTPTLTRQTLNTLLPLAALDNDGDWGTNTRIQGSAGIIRDDSNENQIPDGNWDTIAETTSGIDPITGVDNRDFSDNDYDGRVDDNGDANNDGLIHYDPERHLDEDRPTYAGIVSNATDPDFDDREILTRLINPGGAYFENIHVGRHESPEVLPLFEDRIDNNNNSARWLADGIDNDGDGLTDETLYDEVLNNVRAEFARDEGVDEPGEWYVFSWDDDVLSGGYDNIDNDDDGLTDLLEGDLDEDLGLTLEKNGNRFVFQCDEDPIDLQFVANLADAMDYSTDITQADGANKFSILNASRGYTAEAFGMEAMRITEVLARPLIRLQAEDADTSPVAGSGDWLGPDDHGLTDRAADFHFVNSSGSDEGTWVFDEAIPKGKYYVLIYSFNNGNEDTNYNLDNVSATIDSTDGPLVQVDRNAADHYDSETFSEVIFPSTSTVRSWMRTGSRPHVLFTDEPVEIEGSLTVNLNATNPDSDAPNSFDYIELYAPDAQYLEMVNFGEKPINLAGWEIRLGSDTFKVDDEDYLDNEYLVRPGQFALIFPQDEAKEEDEGPSGIVDLYPKVYQEGVGPEPLILTAEDLIDSETRQFYLTSSLEDILFASSTSRVVEIWSPELNLLELQDYQSGSADLNGASKTLIDAFYFNGSSDDCSVLQTFHRQDRMAFFPQRRGDPTVSHLRHDKNLLDASNTIERYVHAPVKFLADDAVVTFDPDGDIDENEVIEGSEFKPRAILGRSLASGEVGAEDERTEYGEIIFGLTEQEQQVDDFDNGLLTSDDNTVTFHWPGILNHFRDPFAPDRTENTPGVVDGLPILYVRGYGVPNTPLGMFDRDTTDSGEDERLRWHGDLLFVFDPNENEDEFEDVVNIDTDSIRITLRVPDSADIPEGATKVGATTIPAATFAFSYLEISAGYPETDGFMACDPGTDFHFYEDRDLTVDENARFLYMQRRRINDPNLPIEAVSERSLRFREGPLANCSPYLAGAFGRNIEKYSMGRGVFSGPTPAEMNQIATRMEFLSDPTVDGLLNVNVADQKVLCALPFFPPETEPQVFADVRNRLRVAGLMSQVLVMGRSQRGFDGEIGNPETGSAGDDDGDGAANLQDLGYTDGGGNPLTDRYAPSWDPQPFGSNGFGVFNFDDNGNNQIDEPLEYRSPGSDDGPYASVGDAVVPMMNPLVLQELRRLNTEMGNVLRPPGVVALIDQSDIYQMLGRITNLITVHANEFIVISKGRVIDSEVTEQDPELNNVLAEQHLEEDLAR